MDPSVFLQSKAYTGMLLLSFVISCALTSVQGGRALAIPAMRTVSFLTKSQDVTKLPVWRIRGGSTEMMEGDEESESEDEGEEKDEEESADESSATSANPLESVISMKPLPLTVKTALGQKVLDQSIELTVNRSRNIASVKESLRRQLPGRPPVASMELVLHGRRLPDSMLIDELVDEEDEEDDDDEEEGEASSVLVLQLDMIPPVDPKFVPQLEKEMEDLTSSELLEAYVANEASIYKNAALLMQNQGIASEREGGDYDREDNEEDDDESVASTESSHSLTPLTTVQIREQAQQLRQALEQNVLNTPNAQKVLSSVLAPSALRQSQLLDAKQIRGERVRHMAVSSVRTSFRRQVQHIWNIDWATSVRYFMLFLFFGWFGGRTATSRAILLLGAPSVFVLQARPVKLALKQVLYTLLDHPPSILLSLLPAPQQTILSLDVDKAMRTIYGNALTAGAAATSADSAGSLGLANDDDDDEENDDEVYFSAQEDFEESEEEESDFEDSEEEE